MKIKNNKGFTLIELLVVIAIIGILAVVAVPSMMKNIDRAKFNQFKNDLIAFEFTIKSFYIENARMPEQDEWAEAVENSIDGNFTIESGEVIFDAPFSKNDQYIFHIVHGNNNDPTAPVESIRIGGFNLNQNVVDLIKKDDVVFEIDSSDSQFQEYITNRDLKDSYLSNKNVIIYKNGTVWVTYDAIK